MKTIALEQIPLEADAEEDVLHYRLTERGRLILDTVHGRVVIDVRAFDVNAYTLEHGLREDHLLIRRRASST